MPCQALLYKKQKNFDKNKKNIDKKEILWYHVYRLKERASKGRMVKDHEKIRKNI